MTRQELLFCGFFLLASSLLSGEFFHIQVGKDIVTTLKLPIYILTICMTFSLLPHWHIAVLSWLYLIYSALRAVEANTRTIATLWCYLRAPAPTQLKISWLPHCFMVACVMVKAQIMPKRKGNFLREWVLKQLQTPPILNKDTTDRTPIMWYVNTSPHLATTNKSCVRVGRYNDCCNPSSTMRHM